MKNRMTKVTITPEMAKQFLERSQGNRGIRTKTKLIAYRKDMERGAWIYNGDAIRFSYEGVLLDGHHRLTACVESGCSFESDIVKVPASSVGTMDRGAPRSTADILVMDFGYPKKAAGIVSSSVWQIVAHDHGAKKWPTPGGAYSHLSTYHVISEWMEEHADDIEHPLDFVMSLDKANLLIGSSHICTAAYLGTRSYGADVAIEYLKRVLTGYGITPKTTEDHIRTSLIQSKMAQRKMPTWVAAMTIAKGMRAFAKGHNYSVRTNAVYRPNSDHVIFYK